MYFLIEDKTSTGKNAGVLNHVKDISKDQIWH
jgi:hypothetical protein